MKKNLKKITAVGLTAFSALASLPDAAVTVKAVEAKMEK